MPQPRTKNAQSCTERREDARSGNQTELREQRGFTVITQEYAVLRSFLLFFSCIRL
jgi:hypothetical protein